MNKLIIKISFAFLILFFFVFLYILVPNKKIENKKIEQAKIIQIAKIYEGEVIEVNNNLVTFKTTSAETFLINMKEGGYKTPEVGCLLRIQLIPYKYTNDNKIIAKIGKIGYKKIRKYSKQFGGVD
jgi:hypothetical protein